MSVELDDYNLLGRYREYPDEIPHEDPATYEKFAEPEGEDET